MTHSRRPIGWMADNHIGERMKAARKAANLTAPKIEAIGVCCRDTIYAMEHNEFCLSTPILIGLCRLYKVKLTDILEEAL